jgi:Tol biopolymer transport system component
MGLTPGAKFGPFEVGAELGAGGMGTVYRARDSRLNREVALKFLGDLFTNDPDRLARFKREAQLLASMNHPNIAAIYGVEEVASADTGQAPLQALVLELVEGPTLADRITAGPVPLDEALPIARQIAEALRAAHARGVVHRDLKPANIKVRSDGTVKVLDFGLAKAVTDEHASGLSHSPTITLMATRAGVLIGTAAYMSPEQARGKSTDERTDIWAFGCVLFEMLTGQVAFAGETVSDIIAATLSRDPDWNRLPDGTPAGIRRLLRRSMEKDPQRRLHHIADARLEIDDAMAGADQAEPVQTVSRYGSLVAVGALMLTIGVVGDILVSRARSASPTAGGPTSVRYTISATGMPAGEVPAISRDGRRVAYVARASDGSTAIWVRDLDRDQPQEIMSTAGAENPFWSPDGASLAFFADGALKRIDLSGGSAQRLASAQDPFGGSWGSRGVIVFSQRYSIYQIPAAGGTASLVANVDLARQENSLRYPDFLPDGKRFLYVARSGRPDQHGAYLASVDGGHPRRLFATRSAVRYAGGNELAYLRDETLVAQPFDADFGRTTGEPHPIVGGISSIAVGPVELFSMAENGSLIYRRPTENPRQLTWVDRTGRVLSALGDPGVIANFRISPDGGRVVADKTERGYRSVWVVDLTTKTWSRLTFPGSDDWQPIWSSDGARILFGSYRDGPINMYIKSANGAGNDEPFLVSNVQKGPRDWSSDGRYVLYTTDTPDSKEDLLARDAKSGADPIVIAATPAREYGGRFSPDGRFVAYVSNETGNDEIYVQTFPVKNGKWQVSSRGGDSPRWRADGRELFYRTRDGQIGVVAVTLQPSFAAGQPRQLFDQTVSGLAPGTPGNTSFEVAADGQRFLLSLPAGAARTQDIGVVLGWRGAHP